MIKTAYRIFFTLFCLFAWIGATPSNARAESGAIRFETLTVEDGLSQSTIRAIAQDGNGFIWFGTDEGLNQYDGYQFTQLKHDPDNTNSLIDDVITSLFTDRNGDLWIGTPSGLDHYDIHSRQFKHYPFVEPGSPGLWGSSVQTIIGDASGNLWIGTHDGGLNFLNRANGYFAHNFLDSGTTGILGSDQVEDLAINRDGNIWVATQGGLFELNPLTKSYTRFWKQTFNPFSLSDSNCLSVYIDGSGVLWVGTAGGLNRYDWITRRFRHFSNDPENPSTLIANTVNQLLGDDKGNLWIGTPQGLDRLEKGSDLFIHYSNDSNDLFNLSDETITSLFQDRSGVFWVGTSAGGVNYYSRSANKFHSTIQKTGDLNGLSDSAVYGIAETPDGMLWIGTMSGGLNRLNRRTGSVRYYYHLPSDPSSLSSDQIRVLYSDSAGDLWIGTFNAGLDRYGSATDSFTHYMIDPLHPGNLDQYSITSIFEDSQGNLWVGTGGFGFHRLDRTNGTFEHFQIPDQDDHSGWITTMMEDPQGRLWLGTAAGLYIYDVDQNRFSVYKHDPGISSSLPDGEVTSICPVGDGTYWLAILRSGIVRFDPDKGVLANFAQPEGLANETVYGILGEENGRIWVSTNKGLSRFDPDSWIFRNYDLSDGLPGNEFNPGASYRSPRGEFFFGGMNGLVSFFPADIQDNPVEPQVVIRYFKRFNQIERQDLLGGENIQLSYRDNFISFEFAALDYTAPQKNLFAYQLVGFDKDWVYSGTRNYVSYTNLSGGDYVLNVKAANSDGVWNDEGISVSIHVEPPFWTHGWFIGLITLALAGGVFSAYRFRVHTIESQNRDLERQIVERTQETEHRRQVAESLREIIAILNSDHSLPFSLQLIIDQTKRLVKADAALIFHSGDEDNPQILASNIPGELCLSKWLLKTILEGSPLMISDLSEYKDHRSPGDNGTFPTEGALLGMPLSVSDHVDGGLILYFHKAGEISEEDLKTTQTMAEHTSLAIANAHLRSQAEELAKTAERNRLARDLHDAVTQSLFASTLIADVLPRIFRRDPSEGQRRLEELRMLTRGALAEMRTLLVELRPGALSDAPLNELLQQLCDAISGRLRVPVCCSADLLERLPPDIQVAFYRIAQEALNNVARHAHASQVDVQLKQFDGTVEMTVKDNGVGFDQTANSSAHFGLGIMRERAECIGAQFHLFSQPGAGTVVQVEWRLNPEQVQTGIPAVS